MTVEAPPDPIIRVFLPELREFLDRVERTWLASPFQTTSWWRSVDRNRAVGGERFSQHLVGLGLDAVPTNGTTTEDLQLAAQRAGLRAFPASRHVHLQLWPAGQLEQLLRSLR